MTPETPVDGPESVEPAKSYRMQIAQWLRDLEADYEAGVEAMIRNAESGPPKGLSGS
jgi:hypothetical protein